MITFPKFILIWLIVLVAIAVCLLFPPAALVIPVGAAYLLQMIIEKVFEKALSVEENRGKKDDTEESEETEDE